ncbi:MAG: hypothetical protein LBU08_00800 [Tannerellaceae bacterium]|jgi:hypothetical protein|nr:hypothetical protein [Tannerellaceae bacterium]
MKTDSYSFVSIDENADAVDENVDTVDENADAVWTDAVTLEDSDVPSDEGDFIMLAEDSPLLLETDTLDMSLADWDTGTDSDVLVIV